jgi:hypothetical protein
MKSNTASLSALGTLVLAALLVVGILKIQQAHAQVDATSSDAVATSSTNTTPATDTTTSTATDTPTAPSTDAVTTTAPSDSITPVETPPQGMTKVHIIGTKYTDYFTDGTTVTAYPGNPAIDSNFGKPDAPIPMHEGLTWVHTTGGNLYDTPSGDLEVGDYAVQSNGTNIVNAPPFVSSTSTPAVLGASTSALPDTSSTSTTTPAPTDTVAPTTTSTDSTTTSSNQ